MNELKLKRVLTSVSVGVNKLKEAYYMKMKEFIKGVNEIGSMLRGLYE